MGSPDSYSTPVDFRITSDPQPSGNSKSDYNFQELYDFVRQAILTFVQYCGIGTFDTSLWANLATTPSALLFAGNVNKIYVVFSVDATPGKLINLFNNSGVLNARLAIATSLSTMADGYCTGTVAAGDVGEVILGSGCNPYHSSLTLGARYWLSTVTAGNVQTAAPTAAGTISQYVGMAIDVVNINTNLGPPIQN